MDASNWPRRFSSKVDVRSIDECWNWNAVKIPGGYGQFWFEGKMRNAHRMALHFCGVTIDAQYVVMHRCDNRLCCNPQHLSIAKQSENMKDMVEKRRSLAGSKHNRAKLDEDAVRQILDSRLSVKELAAHFCVSCAAIYDIRERRTWRHVSSPASPRCWPC